MLFKLRSSKPPPNSNVSCVARFFNTAFPYAAFGSPCCSSSTIIWPIRQYIFRRIELLLLQATDNRPVGSFSNLFGNGNARRSSLDYGKRFSYGLKAGYAGNNIDPNFYVGGYTSFDVNEHWYFSPSVILNSARTISGSYLHDSYFRPDSIPPFTIVDSRKIYFLDLNLNMGYRLSKPISINVGPVISTSFKQTAIDSKVGYVPDMRDTIMHKQAINASLAKTTLSPKLNVGVAGGINIQFRRFNVEGSYQYNLMPYVIKSDLGNYKLNYHSFKIGIGFQFNKSR